MEKHLNLSLFSDTVFDINGVSRFIQDLAKEAHRREESLSIVTASPLSPPLEAEGITVIDHWAAMTMPHYPTQFLVFPSLRQLHAHFKAFPPDVVHISTPGPIGWNALRYARRFGCPVTSTYHTNFPQYVRDISGSFFLYRLTVSLMRAFYRRCDLVFTRSKEYTAVLEEEIGIPAEKIIYLHPGIDTQKFNPSFRNETLWERYPDISPDTVKLLYVGRLSEEKNFPFLLELFRAFQDRRQIGQPEVELIVLGEGVFLKEQDYWRAQGVHMLGVKRDTELSELYASCDLFVFPSVTETLGQAVMEAQASGLPALVSDQGGPQSIITPNKTGYVLSVDNPAPWIDTIDSLCNNMALCKEMGKSAHMQMREKSFSKSFDIFWSIHKNRFASKG